MCSGGRQLWPLSPRQLPIPGRLDINLQFRASAVTSSARICICIGPLMCTYTYFSSVPILLFSKLKMGISLNLFFVHQSNIECIVAPATQTVRQPLSGHLHTYFHAEIYMHMLPQNTININTMCCESSWLCHAIGLAHPGEIAIKALATFESLTCLVCGEC